MFIFFQSRSLAEPLATSCGNLGFRGTPVEKPWSTGWTTGAQFSKEVRFLTSLPRSADEGAHIDSWSVEPAIHIHTVSRSIRH
jgi:hypothetical protein